MLVVVGVYYLIVIRVSIVVTVRLCQPEWSVWFPLTAWAWLTTWTWSCSSAVCIFTVSTNEPAFFFFCYVVFSKRSLKSSISHHQHSPNDDSSPLDSYVSFSLFLLSCNWAHAISHYLPANTRTRVMHATSPIWDSPNELKRQLKSYVSFCSFLFTCNWYILGFFYYAQPLPLCSLSLASKHVTHAASPRQPKWLESSFGLKCKVLFIFFSPCNWYILVYYAQPLPRHSPSLASKHAYPSYTCRITKLYRALFSIYPW